MNQIIYIILACWILTFIILYMIFYVYLLRKINRSEKYIIDIFLQKISKIPAVIEVMRPYVLDPDTAFGLMVNLHSAAIIYEYASIHNLLEHNARMNDQYWFLMRLSMAIPQLQKDIYFLYIRDFVMSYDHMMKNELPLFNSLVKKWNLLIKIKKYSIIWYIFPGREMVEV